jgi:hypothetical protein
LSFIPSATPAARKPKCQEPFCERKPKCQESPSARNRFAVQIVPGTLGLPKRPQVPAVTVCGLPNASDDSESPTRAARLTRARLRSPFVRSERGQRSALLPPA